MSAMPRDFGELRGVLASPTPLADEEDLRPEVCAFGIGAELPERDEPRARNVAGRPLVRLAHVHHIHSSRGDEVVRLARGNALDHLRSDTRRCSGRPAWMRLSASTSASMSSHVLYGASDARTVASRPNRLRMGCAQW